MRRHVPERIAIIALMALGSVAMWVAGPLAWIWGVSQLADSSQVTMGQIVAIVAGIAVTMVALARALSALDDLYGRLAGAPPRGARIMPWRRSLRDARDVRAPRTVLDVVMVCSVALALLALAVWFLLFAHGGGLPTTSG